MQVLCMGNRSKDSFLNGYLLTMAQGYLTTLLSMAQGYTWLTYYNYGSRLVTWLPDWFKVPRLPDYPSKYGTKY